MAPTSVVRSSLEEMLESLRRKDEKPKDVPPALPPRPTSKGRLPSQRRSLPVNFKVEEKGPGTEEEKAPNGDQKIIFMTSIFRSKRRAKVDEPEESPYANMPKREKHNDEFMDFNGSKGRLDEKFGWGGSNTVSKEKKLHVWCRLPNMDWESGNIQSIKGDDAVVLLSNSNVLTVSMENLLPANPDILDDADDLVKLSYLNEPSVLRTLKCRYSRDMVYTKAGNVLVAINPFKEVPLYGNDLTTTYRRKKDERPHVYAIADSAYNGMMRDGENQSIIISGESGAGKTETAKIAMQYLASFGSDSGIEHKVLQANFILEAFGNAKTSRNDNSSRYGKLIEIHFNRGGKFCGAMIQTFLLEKTRVAQREKGERSYHIFYQLCAGASHLLKERLNLKAANKYEFLKQSDCLRIDSVDDAQRFHMLMEALNIFNISKEDQEYTFAMLAAVLWLGNIEFEVIDSENHVEVMTNEGVTSAAKLMGCEVSELKLALSTRKFQEGNDCIVEKLTLSQANDTRNALANSIYVCLFDRLVEQINKSLEVGQAHMGRSITILDIYGFESLHRNNFEQFCINYANERLQQHFNRHLIKLEQEEYVQDGIDWMNVEFVDNNECLDLFEKRPLGLLSLLDEESSISEATDLTFTNKLKKHLDSNPFFKGESEGAFRIRHYAGEVVYYSSGFLEKNRDILHSDFVKLLSTSHCQFSQLLASYILSQSQGPYGSFEQIDGADSQRQSVGSKFKGQLFKLMQCLENSTPHFIKCIKPNSNQLPGMFENEHVLQQLRCSGVLEIVKISKAGYPFRITHQRFAERYGFLLLENVASEDPLSIAVTVLRKFNVLPEMYQVGYTKLFFRTGQIAALENVRKQTIQGILWVQKCHRGLEARRNFQELKKGATTFQSFIRGHLVRRSFIAMKNVGSKAHHMKVNNEVDKNLQGIKDTYEKHPLLQSSVSTELEMQVLNTEATLRQKEEENDKLREELQEYKKRCLENEAKMKSMEEAWKKQMTTLQMSMGGEKEYQHSGMLSSSPAQLNYDSDIATSETPHTTSSTPTKPGYMPNGTPVRGSDNSQDTVGCLMKEYEQRKQAFEREAQFLIEMKTASSMNSDEDLRKLKAQFVAWKKDYKVRLRDAKATLQKLGVSDGDKAWRKWWIVKSVKL